MVPDAFQMASWACGWPHVCGLLEVIEYDKVKSHLTAVHRYNLKPTLEDHYNPQRPTYACGEDGDYFL